MSGFKDVVGHKNIIKYIESAVSADAVSHAYILNGERGSGKKMLANLFAMSLQCQNRQEDGDACGKCQSCKQAVSGNHPDIIRVTHEKPNTISVDDIREQVNNDIVIKPYSSKYKIYISARSVGEVNVQLIMEKLGGGGHSTMAGAQLTGCTVQEALEYVKVTIKQMLDEGEI